MPNLTKKEKWAAFGLGAIGYPLIEILWRKRTHVSMAVAGGLCCSLLYRIHLRDKPLLSRCLSGALSITAVELVTGLIVNRWLRLRVWDYSGDRFHLLGQICLRYTIYWFILSGLVSPLCKKMREFLTKMEILQSNSR